MNKVFDDDSFMGIVKPGDIYILREKLDTDCIGIPFGGLYALRSDEEIRFAMLMLMVVMRIEDVEVRKYLGIKKLRKEDDYTKTYEIRLLCRNNPTGELFIERLILESLRTFQEDIEWVKKDFPLQ
ncbi:MAG TPA: hypothetical protein VGS79_00420 [Puia sp.]|nr:hypothetical protein [Puia sp.]